MAASVHAEVERKYDVEAHVGLPDRRVLAQLPGVAVVEGPAEERLDATYVDTAGLDLAAHRVTLRRRTGGHDAGWTLKLPVSREERQEVTVPLGPADEPVPKELLDRVRAHVRDHPVTPLVRISTTRQVHRLIGDGGVLLAWLVDDQVTATPLRQGSGASSWREWEVELTSEGGRELWDALDEVVGAAGATLSASGSKLARSLGDGAPEPPSPVRLSRRSPAGDVLRLALTTQVEALKTQDAAVRRGAGDSVHQLRIASRRLRSTLATYRPLLRDPAAAQAVRDELQWLGLGLNTARDTQVMQARLASLLDQEPEQLVVGPVRERIAAELTERFTTGLREGLALLDEERYFRLLDALDALVTAPLTARADKPAGQVIDALLRRNRLRLHRAARRAARAEDREQRDLALHEVRKAAKRLRYAAETARPALGKPMKKLAGRAKALQDVLGEHQDGVVCRALLLDLAAVATAHGENAFTYGRLHAHEEALTATQETAYRQALAALG
ncbi:CYTH and CHAD domain-containing protein [Oryzihumus sp.]|uniref:CYTH and CHAD domain-containing protein n=1 Tax=Oryzihumus sp. TaxID=1968903 RepID=UPI002EDA9613